MYIGKLMLMFVLPVFAMVCSWAVIGGGWAGGM